MNLGLEIPSRSLTPSISGLIGTPSNLLSPAIIDQHSLSHWASFTFEPDMTNTASNFEAEGYFPP